MKTAILLSRSIFSSMFCVGRIFLLLLDTSNFDGDVESGSSRTRCTVREGGQQGCTEKDDLGHSHRDFHTLFLPEQKMRKTVGKRGR